MFTCCCKHFGCQRTGTRSQKQADIMLYFFFSIFFIVSLSVVQVNCQSRQGVADKFDSFQKKIFRNALPNSETVSYTGGTNRHGEKDRTVHKNRDFFVEFYTGVSSLDVDKQNLQQHYTSVISKLQQAALSEKLQAINLKPDNHGTVDLMSRLFASVNSGQLPDKELLNTAVPPGVESFWSQIQGEVTSQGSFVEIGGCVTSFQIAADHPNITVVAISLTEDHLRFCSENARDGGLVNYNLVYSRPGELTTLIESLYGNPEVLFEAVFLSNLTLIAEGLLPHEFEEMLSRVLSLSRVTYIITTHMDKKRKLYFSTQWPSVSELLNKSCQLGGLFCHVTTPYMGDKWDGGGVVTVTVKQGVRDLSEEICFYLIKRYQCLMLFSSETSKVVVQSGLGEIFPLLTNSSGLPLQVLLDINPVEMTKQKICNQLLDIPFPPPSSATSNQDQYIGLFLKGTQIIWKKAEMNAYSWSEQDIIPTTAQNFDHVLESFEGTKFDNLIEKHDTVNSKGKDGIETGKVKELDNHWQREEDHQNNNVIDKEKNAADHIWNREKDNDQIRSKEIQNEPSDKLKAELARQGEEPGLTNEEQELQRAIGFLHGRSEMKDKEIRIFNQNQVDIDKSIKANDSKKKSAENILKTAMAKKVIDNSNTAAVKRISNIKVSDNGDQKNDNVVPHDQNSEDDQRLKFKGREQVAESENKDGLNFAGQRHLLSLPQRYLDKLEKAKEELLKDKPGMLYSAMLNSSTQLPLSSSTANEGNYQVHNVKKLRGFAYRRRDHQWYDHYWRILHPVFVKEIEQGEEHFNLLTYGGEAQSLLGLKVASMFPSSTVVTIMSTASQPILPYIRQTMKTLKQSNCLLMVNDVTPDVLNDLVSLPELFRFQVLGMEVFTHLVSLGSSYLYYLGQWLTLARTTVLEVPDPQLLHLAYTTLRPPSGQGKQLLPTFKGFVDAALRLVGAQASSMRILAGHHHHGYRPNSQRRLLLIELGTMKRQVFSSCTLNQSELYLEVGGGAYLHHVTSKGQQISSPIGRAGSGVGLEFILRIGPPSFERKLLFQKYLRTPVFEDMCPVHLVYFNQTLVYHPVLSPVPHLTTNNQEAQARQLQALLQILSIEFGSQPFSFLEYNSGEGALISSLTFKYRNSTFISLQEETTLAEKLYKDVRGENLDNLVIAKMDINRQFTQKLLKSPDFLRYQYIGSDEFLHLLTKTSQTEFGQFLGEVFSTSVTSFVQVPSDQIFSLAMRTFFPEVHATVPDTSSGNSKSTDFLRASHPLPVYKGAGLKFLQQGAKADVNVTLSAEVISPLSDTLVDGATVPWRIVRLDVKNLSAQVDHHFDYSLDGHSRKYRQHCISHNKTSYEVFLVREQDGFKIPYGNVYAISLIALLRMGLLPRIKSEFYDKFLQLPLYEDMAPWNIVFQAGQLDYIDYDSKDVTFDHLVPAAYQVLAMLMNYERTIKDFDHCGQHAQNQYQFKLISNCVGGSDFSGPCKDSRYPVPCGDHSCRSTFIECLQVLNEMEKKKNRVLSSGNLGVQKLSEINSDLDTNNGLWSYNSHGRLRNKGS